MYQHNSQTSSIEDLPSELLLHIFFLLFSVADRPIHEKQRHLKDRWMIMNLSETSRRFGQIVTLLCQKLCRYRHGCEAHSLPYRLWKPHFLQVNEHYSSLNNINQANSLTSCYVQYPQNLNQTSINLWQVSSEIFLPSLPTLRPNIKEANVLTLLDHGLSPTPSTLASAAGSGHLQVVKRHISSNISVDACDSVRNRRPLHHATQSGQLHVMYWLLSAGADPNVVDFNGSTPLHSAPSPPAVFLLLSFGADQRIKDRQGFTPFQMARYRELHDIAHQLLLNDSPNLGKRPPLPSEMISFLIRAEDSDPNVSVIKELITIDSFRSALEEETYSPLHEACALGRTEIVKLLIENGINVDRSYHDQRPIHRAVSGGHLQIVDLLLRYGSNPNKSSCDVSSPLTEACRKGHDLIATLLLIRGADPYPVCQSSSECPMYVAAQSQNGPLLSVMLERIAGNITRDNKLLVAVENWISPAIHNSYRSSSSCSSLSSSGHSFCRQCGRDDCAPTRPLKFEDLANVCQQQRVASLSFDVSTESEGRVLGCGGEHQHQMEKKRKKVLRSPVFSSRHSRQRVKAWHY